MSGAELPDTVVLDADGEPIDLVAVERCLSGGPPWPRLTAAEQRYAARELTEAGVPYREIAVRVGTYERKVTRWQKRWGKGAS